MKKLPPAPDVSRETSERLKIYENLLRKWSPKINLVSRTTLDQIAIRHLRDSAQIFSLSPQGVTSWIDMGSGGGFPGLVVAILGAELSPDMRVTLIESDQRKCAFLRTVARDAGVSVNVMAERVESVPPAQANVVSARALADLTRLLGFAQRHLADGGIALFPKGTSWEKEVEDARRAWSFELEPYMSETEANSVILKIKDIKQ